MILHSERSWFNVRNFPARTSSSCWSCVPWCRGVECSSCTSSMNIFTVHLADLTWNPYEYIVKVEGDTLWSMSEVPCHIPASLAASPGSQMTPLLEIPGESINNWNPPYTMNQAHSCLVQLLLDLVLPMVYPRAEPGHSEDQTSHPSAAPKSSPKEELNASLPPHPLCASPHQWP